MPHPPQDSPVKKPFLIIMAVAVSYATAELLSLALYSYHYGEAYNATALRSERLGATTIDGAPQTRKIPPGLPDAWGDHTAAHPYLGYVHDATTVNPLWQQNGFLAESDPYVASQNANNAIIGITGASVAEFFFKDEQARTILRTALEKLPRWKNKTLIFAMFGMAGYHQPQQLLSVTYYLAQGGTLDMLINIDGLNETAWANTVTQKGMYPTYPAYWAQLLPDVSSHVTLQKLGDLQLWKNLRRLAANAFSHASFSVTANTMWKLLDDTLRDRIRATLRELYDIPATTYSLSGSNALRNASAQELADFETRLWRQSSLQLYYLAQANHFTYLHFLQPNQYLPASKTLSPLETRNAYDPHSGYRVWIPAQYPLLQAQIPTLQAEGVAAFDLSGIYKTTAETIYIDTCCHTNALGKQLLAKAIARHITAAANVSAPPHPPAAIR
jgi:hypothetical protein